MAKKSESKKTKPKSAGLMTEVAVENLAFTLGRKADIDEVLRQAGLTRQRLSVLMVDDEIAQAMETRLDAVLNAPWRFVEDHGEQTVFLKELFTRWHAEIVSGAWEACPYGYSVMEANYALTSDNKFTLGEIVVKPLEWFEPKNNGELIYRQEQTEIDVNSRYPLKFFLTRRKPTFKQPYGDPLLSKLYWLWFFRTNTTKFWVKFLERFGSPLLVGKVGTSNRKQEDIDAMTSALLNAHAQSVISINKEDDVATVGTNFSGAGSSAFEAFDNVLTRRIQKVVLGQTLTSSTDGGGSRALGEVHNDVRLDKRNSDLRMITPTIQELIDALCLLNNFEKHTIILGGEQDLKVAVVDRDIKLKSLGVEFNDQYVIETYGIKMNTSDAVPNTKFSALPHQAFSFKASVQKQSPEQQEVDSLAVRPMQLLSDDQIVQIAASSESIEDMQNKLFSLFTNAESSQFNEALDRALFTADVMGFVDSKEGK